MRLRALAALAAALAAGRADAFRQSTDADTGAPLSWRLPLVPYAVNPSHPYAAPSCAATAAGDPVLGIARASFGAWEQGCANLGLLYSGPIDEIRVATVDGHENVVVMRQGWCSTNAQATASGCLTNPDVDCGNLFNCFEDTGTHADHATVALTSVLHDVRTGRIVSADIELNGWDGQGGGSPILPANPAPRGWYFTCDKQTAWSACTAYGQDACYYMDLQNTLTHEAGHFVGLAHPCEIGSCTPAMQATTMSPSTAIGETSKRTLSADDIAGVCAIYPASGGCGCGSGGGGTAVAGLLALISLRPRRRRT